MTTLEIPTKLSVSVNDAITLLAIHGADVPAAAVRQLRDLYTSQHLAHEATIQLLEERDKVMGEVVRMLMEQDVVNVALVDTKKVDDDLLEVYLTANTGAVRATLTKLKESMK
ncbi:MAG: hypothetical protein KGL39_48175 [Patescibacteria group bacterium]|nr:hypothetical protein [Patescibacteria group bacterium]